MISDNIRCHISLLHVLLSLIHVDQAVDNNSGVTLGEKVEAYVLSLPCSCLLQS